MRTTDRRKRDREANRHLQGHLETKRSLRTVQRMPRTQLRHPPTAMTVGAR